MPRSALLRAQLLGFLELQWVQTAVPQQAARALWRNRSCPASAVTNCSWFSRLLSFVVSACPTPFDQRLLVGNTSLYPSPRCLIYRSTRPPPGHLPQGPAPAGLGPTLV